jgi:iron(III) transport system ATP-binding protein
VFVDDLSFTIEPGTLVTLLGPSGCAQDHDTAVDRRAGNCDAEQHRDRWARRGPVKLAIRPEAISLHTTNPGGRALPGRILKMAYVGSHFECSIETILGALFVINRAKSQPTSSDAKTWITFADHGIGIVPT